MEIGNTVQYSKNWLRNTGQYTGDICFDTGDICFAKGVVKELEPFGKNELATIEWDKPDIPERVLACNLKRVK